ncbi:beta-1,3-glucanase family protein [Actinoplanes sp. NPDC051411]|uniref:beta-1,3-glucanase family protein n=1 Tax=Actinoplanes sp. NPDC051411 TaxID=3155522 RepID=UPI003432B13A
MRRKQTKILTALAVLAAATAAWFALPASADESPLPFTVTNHTGRGDAVFLYVLGTDLTTGKLGYANASGQFTAWTGGAATPVPAPDVSIPGPSSGAGTTIQIPRNMSGRIYESFGQKLVFKLTTDGLVQPAPWAAGDPNQNILFDWSEFTLNDGGIFLNSTQVDMFAVPQEVSVTSSAGTSSTGAPVTGGRQKIIDEVKGAGDFARSVVTGSDGTVLRILSPGKAADAGLMSPTYYDSYISSAWAAPVTVVPFADQPSVRFAGHPAGDVLSFTDSTGATVATFNKPSTADVWGCDGALAAPNDQVVGPIARTLCAALQRGTLGVLDTQPGGTAADFYRNSTPNVYAKAIHENMADGKAYAFAFDDVQNQESLVHDAAPTSAGITMTAF